MTTNHRPANPLPWALNGSTVVRGLRGRTKVATAVEYTHGNDAAFIVHAANHYPELIEALRLIRLNRDGQIVHRASLERVDALLAKLGELHAPAAPESYRMVEWPESEVRRED